MSDDFYVLSRDDIETIREVVRSVRRQSRNPYGRPPLGEDDLPNASDCYLIRTPPGGINGPTQTGTGTGSTAISNEVTFDYVKVPIYQLVGSFGSTFAAQKINDLHLEAVFAINAVQGDVWCIVQKDKLGNWWVVEGQPSVTNSWVKVTSTATSNVVISGGGTYAVYPAQLSDFTSGNWFDSTTCYLYSVNGNINGACPVLDNRYECQFMGVAADGKSVYGVDIQAELDATTTRWGLVTIATQEFAGLKQFDDGIEVRTTPGNSFTTLNSTTLSFSTTDGPCSIELVEGSLADFTSASDGVGFWTIASGIAMTVPGGAGVFPFDGASADFALAQSIVATGVDDGIGNVVGNGSLDLGAVLYAPLKNPAYCIGAGTELSIGGNASVILNPTAPIADQVRLTFRGGLFLGISGGGGFGTSTGSSGGGGSGPIFSNWCPGKHFNTSYSLTISGGCAALNGTYTLTWNGIFWTFTTTISGHTVQWIMQNSGSPSNTAHVSVTIDGGSDGASNASSMTCPPTFSASGSFVLIGGSALCAGDTINWSVS